MKALLITGLVFSSLLVLLGFLFLGSGGNDLSASGAAGPGLIGFGVVIFVACVVMLGRLEEQPSRAEIAASAVEARRRDELGEL